MIVQPTPTQAPLRRFRARRVAGLVVPPALLAAVVLVGFVGPRETARPAPTDAALPTTLPAEAADPGRPEVQIPSMFGDLAAIPPSEAIDTDAGLLAADAIAVAGYMGVDDTASACFDREHGPFDPWCVRRGILALKPWTRSGTGPFPPHLRIQIPPGVRLPEVI